MSDEPKPQRTVFDCETRQVEEVELTEDELRSHERAAAEAEEAAPADPDEQLKEDIYRIVDEALKERGE